MLIFGWMCAQHALYWRFYAVLYCYAFISLGFSPRVVGDSSSHVVSLSVYTYNSTLTKSNLFIVAYNSIVFLLGLLGISLNHCVLKALQ